MEFNSVFKGLKWLVILHTVWSICFVNFHACVNYGLMFWSGDTGGIEIILDYLNNQWCGETKL